MIFNKTFFKIKLVNFEVAITETNTVRQGTGGGPHGIGLAHFGNHWHKAFRLSVGLPPPNMRRVLSLEQVKTSVSLTISSAY